MEHVQAAEEKRAIEEKFNELKLDYADEKAVEITWKVEKTREATDYFSTSEYWNDGILLGPELYRFHLR